MPKWLLMASFAQHSQLYEAIEKISSTLNIDTKRIFVFKNELNENEYILTYNLDPEYTNIKFSSIWPNTVSIHRKKNTNTLYSLNAMNELIKQKNNGVLDKRYQIKWENYRDKILIIKQGKLKVIPIQMIKINQ